MTHEFPVVAAGIITNDGEILLGKKKESEGHPISGQWHFPGGHVDKRENVSEAVLREVKEETGLYVDLRETIHAYTGDIGVVRILFHCESKDRNAEASDDLAGVKWVDPADLREELGEYEANIVAERKEISKFLEKLQNGELEE